MSEAIRLYAGCQGGVVVYRSQNREWQQASHNFPEGILDSLSGCVKRPERVFAGIAHDGVYRTDDGGKNWTKVLRGDVRSVTVDPNADEVVYAGTEPVHLWRSEDGGDSWEEMSSLMAFAISQGIKNYQTFVVPRDKQPENVKKKWWFIMPPFSPHITNIFVHPDDSKKIYLSIEHGGVMRTLDGGRTWEDVSRGIDYLDIHQVKCLPHSSTRYYASTARGFFTSDDPAAGWVRAENGFTRDYFHNFMFMPSGKSKEQKTPTMLCTTADQSPLYWDRPGNAHAALFRSLDGAQSWHRVGVEKGFAETHAAMVWALATHPYDANAAFAGFGNVARGAARPLPHYKGSGGKGELYLSRDHAESWEKLNLDVPPVRALWVASE